MVITCPRCEHEFLSNIALKRHLGKKIPCYDKKLKAVVNITNTQQTTENILDECFNKENYIFEPLPKFDYRDILKEGQEAKSIIICGTRGSGKTTFINFLYPLLLDTYDIVVFFSFSLHNNLYNDIQDPKFDDYRPELIKELFYFQKKTKNMLSICVVMDDMISENIKNDDGLMQLYTRGRNSNISVIITTQHMNIMKNTNRANCSFIFIGKTSTPKSREVISEDYLLPVIKIPKDLNIKTKSKKIEFLDAWILNHTLDHNFIVVDYFNDGENIYNFKTPV